MSKFTVDHCSLWVYKDIPVHCLSDFCKTHGGSIITDTLINELSNRSISLKNEIVFNNSKPRDEIFMLPDLAICHQSVKYGLATEKYKQAKAFALPVTLYPSDQWVTFRKYLLQNFIPIGIYLYEHKK